ncbi:MAG: formylglycine-generating enzyme family protein [Lentisphaerales bacterium]|nr:formylglycine-generating enzyme family protein [Lentisphaerales bacterium]
MLNLRIAKIFNLILFICMAFITSVSAQKVAEFKDLQFTDAHADLEAKRQESLKNLQVKIDAKWKEYEDKAASTGKIELVLLIQNLAAGKEVDAAKVPGSLKKLQASILRAKTNINKSYDNKKSELTKTQLAEVKKLIVEYTKKKEFKEAIALKGFSEKLDKGLLVSAPKVKAKAGKKKNDTKPEINKQNSFSVGSNFKLSDSIEVVSEASFTSLEGLAEGSRKAQELQKKASKKFPLEINLKKTGIIFRLIPSGDFTMENPSSEDGSDDEDQQRDSIEESFYLGKFEVTQEQWQQVMGNNPSHFKSSDSGLPVEQVSWVDCQEFIAKLEVLEGLPKGCLNLPTQAQWEYACRAGTKGDFAGDLDSVAWFKDNSDARTHRVGQKKANAWGFYEMHGNVWEWCLDWYSSDREKRVIRGGSCSDEANRCRSQYRYGIMPGSSGLFLGFRVAFQLAELK